MTPKEIKKALKAAKSALSTSSYPDVLTHTASVLAASPSHYLANVLSGMACARSSPPLTDQARAHYTAATEADPDAAPAWQGLFELARDSEDYPALLDVLHTLPAVLPGSAKAGEWESLPHKYAQWKALADIVVSSDWHAALSLYSSSSSSSSPDNPDGEEDPPLQIRTIAQAASALSALSAADPAVLSTLDSLASQAQNSGANPKKRTLTVGLTSAKKAAAKKARKQATALSSLASSSSSSSSSSSPSSEIADSLSSAATLYTQWKESSSPLPTPFTAHADILFTLTSTLAALITNTPNPQASVTLPILRLREGSLDDPSSHLSPSEWRDAFESWLQGGPWRESQDPDALEAVLSQFPLLSLPVTLSEADHADGVRILNILRDPGSPPPSSVNKATMASLRALNDPQAYVALADVLHPEEGARMAAALVGEGEKAAQALGAARNISADKLRSSLQLRRARVLFDSGSEAGIASAKALLESILQADNSSPALVGEASGMLGKVYYHAGEFESAVPALESIPEKSPWVWEALGWSKYQMNDLDGAMENLKASVAADPSRSSAHLRLGIVYLEAGGETATDPAYASVSLLKAARLDPSSGQAFYFLGQYYAGPGDSREKAKRCLKKTLALDQSHASAASLLCSLLMEDGEGDAVLDLARMCIASGVDSKWAHQMVGLDHLATLTHPSSPSATWGAGEEESLLHAAIPHVQRALRSDPNDHALWEVLAFSYWRAGKYAAGLKVIRHIRPSLDDASILGLFIEGSLAAILGELADADAVFDVLTTRDPTFAPGLVARAGFLVAAARIYTGVAVAPRFGAAALVLQQAVDLCLQARETPEGASFALTDKVLGDAHVGLAHILQGGDAVASAAAGASAVQAYKAALAKRGDHDGLLWHDMVIAGSLAAGNEARPEEVEALLEHAAKAVEAEPKSALLAAAQGVVLARAGRVDEAYAALAVASGKAGRVPDPVAAGNMAIVGAMRYLDGELGEDILERQLRAVQVADPESSLAWTLRGVTRVGCPSVSELHGIMRSANLTGVSAREGGFFAQTLEGVVSAREDVKEAARVYLGVNPHDLAVANLLGRKYEEEGNGRGGVEYYRVILNQIALKGGVEGMDDSGLGLVTNVIRGFVSAGASGEALGVLNALEGGDLIQGYSGTSGTLLRLRGRALYFAGQHQEAIGAFQAAYEAGDGEVKIHVALDLARVAFALDNVQVAAQYLELVLGVDPSHLVALCTLAEIMVGVGDAARAEELVARVRGSGVAIPPEAYVLMANIAGASGDPGRASRFVQAAIHVAPWEGALWNALGRVWMESELMLTSRAPRVIRTALRGSEVVSRDVASVLEKLGLVATSLLYTGLEAGEDARSANTSKLRASARKAHVKALEMVRLDPTGYQGWLLSGAALRARVAAGDPVSLLVYARQALERSVRCARDAKEGAVARMALASLLLDEYEAGERSMAGLLQAAVDHASVALGVYGQGSVDAAPALFLLARARLALDDVDAARESLLAALAADPQHMRGWELLGRVYEMMGACGAGEKAYRQAMRFSRPGPGKVIPLVRAALMYVRAGDMGSAVRVMKEAGKKGKKKSGMLLFLKGVLYMAQGQRQQGGEALSGARDAHVGVDVQVAALS